MSTEYTTHEDNPNGVCSGCGQEECQTARSTHGGELAFYCPFCYETAIPALTRRGEPANAGVIAQCFNILLRELRAKP